MEEYIATVTKYGRGQRQVSLTDEEIVRCGDCEYYREPQARNGWSDWCKKLKHPIVPDGFCAWGCRR